MSINFSGLKKQMRTAPTISNISRPRSSPGNQDPKCFGNTRGLHHDTNMKQDWEIVALDDSIAKRKETRNAIILESGKTRIVSKIDFNDGQIQL